MTVLVCGNCGTDLDCSVSQATRGGEHEINVYPCTNCKPDVRSILKDFAKEVLTELADELDQKGE